MYNIIITTADKLDNIIINLYYMWFQKKNM